MQELLQITTFAAPVGQKHRYWTRQVTEHLSTLEIDVRRKLDFNASISLRSLGPLRVALVDAEFQAVTHNADGRDDRLQLVLVEKGFLELERFGRRLMVEAGDWCLLDERESYSFETSETCSCVVLQMPGTWTRSFIPELGGALISRRNCEPHWRDAMSYALKAVGSRSMPRLPMDDIYVAENLAGLLSLSLGPSHETNLPGQKGSLMRAIRRLMKKRFCETGLTAADIASEIGISRRYLNTIFAQEGTTFRSELLNLRIARAKQILSDKRFRSVSISQIADQVGFPSPAGFAKNFRDFVKLLPSDFRQAASDSGNS